MPLPANFRFSQASLTDYLDCPRRFQLRHVLQQAWPAVESEPLLERERLAELGRRFHRLLQQHTEGLNVELLTESCGEPDLARWWQCYLHSLATVLSDLPRQRRAEVAMSIPIVLPTLSSKQPATSLRAAQAAAGSSYRLTAHFDLIAAAAERVVIVDWKTEQRLPPREQLLRRMQTRVYRYVLATVQQCPPGMVSMIYWFAQYPDQPVTLPYDAAQYADDHCFLLDLIAEIGQRAAQEGEWDKSASDRKCAYCVYRSLCNRGVQAGSGEPDEEDFDLVALINIDQIAAIEY